MRETLYDAGKRVGFSALCDACGRICLRADLDYCQACENVRLLLIVPAVRHCRVCGCHEDCGCVRTPPPPMPGRDGPFPTEACSWVDADLCSFCAEREREAA